MTPLIKKGEKDTKGIKERKTLVNVSHRNEMMPVYT
jgi:hypothetical protein